MIANFTSTAEATTKGASPVVLQEHGGPWLQIGGALLSWVCCHTQGLGAFRPSLVSEGHHTLAPSAEGVFCILL